MRLLPLREYSFKSDQFLSMWVDFLIEKQPKNKKTELAVRLQNTLQESIRGTHGEYFLFEYDNEPIGFAIAEIHEECFPDEDLPEVCLQVLAFYIKPEQRRHHFGQMAFKLLRQWGRDKKAALIEIEADSETASHFLSEQGLDFVGKGEHMLYRGFI